MSEYYDDQYYEDILNRAMLRRLKRARMVVDRQHLNRLLERRLGRGTNDG